MKRCLTSLDIRGMKTTGRSHLTFTGMAVIKKKKKITSVGEDVGKLGPFYIAGGNVKWCSHCGRHFSKKIKHRITI